VHTRGCTSVWLICQAAPGRGKNKLLVRGIPGAEWVFCPVKSIKNDRIGTNQCQGCENFIRFEQTYIPQTRTTRKAFFFRTLTPSSKDTCNPPRTLNRSKVVHPRAPLFRPIPSLIKERQPLLDVFEEEDHLIVLAELPGVDKKDVNIKADENTLTISACNKTRKYLRKVWLPTPVQKDTIKSTYKNNVLQVRLQKL